MPTLPTGPLSLYRKSPLIYFVVVGYVLAWERKSELPASSGPPPGGSQGLTQVARLGGLCTRLAISLTHDC